MFMNLHEIPSGKSLYTVYVTVDPQGTARSEMAVEEVDIVARTVGNTASWGEVIEDGVVNTSGENAREWLRDAYGNDYRVVGVVDNSEAWVVYDAFLSRDETGANDL